MSKIKDKKSTFVSATILITLLVSAGSALAEGKGGMQFAGGSGQTSSTGRVRYNLGEGIIAAHEEAIRNEQQLISEEQAELEKVKEQLFAQEASALHSIMKNTKTDTGYNIDTSTELGRDLQKTLQEIDKQNSTNNHGWEQNAKAYLRGEASAGKPTVLERIQWGGEKVMKKKSD